MIPGHFQDRLKTHTGLPTLGLPELLPGSVWLVSSLINQGQGLPRLETKVSNSFEFTFLSWASPLAAYRFRHAGCSASQSQLSSCCPSRITTKRLRAAVGQMDTVTQGRGSGRPGSVREKPGPQLSPCACQRLRSSDPAPPNLRLLLRLSPTRCSLPSSPLSSSCDCGRIAHSVT